MPGTSERLHYFAPSPTSSFYFSPPTPPALDEPRPLSPLQSTTARATTLQAWLDEARARRADSDLSAPAAAAPAALGERRCDWLAERRASTASASSGAGRPRAIRIRSSGSMGSMSAVSADGGGWEGEEWEVGAKGLVGGSGGVVRRESEAPAPYVWDEDSVDGSVDSGFEEEEELIDGRPGEVDGGARDGVVAKGRPVGRITMKGLFSGRRR